MENKQNRSSQPQSSTNQSAQNSAQSNQSSQNTRSQSNQSFSGQSSQSSNLSGSTSSNSNIGNQQSSRSGSSANSGSSSSSKIGGMDMNAVTSKLQEYGTTAMNKVNSLSTTQKVVGGSLLALGAGWLAMNSRNKTKNKGKLNTTRTNKFGRSSS